MKRNVITVLGSLLIFLLTSFSALGQQCSYILTGQVTNASTGAIVSGQTVYLLLDPAIWGPNNTITATTSPNGAYHFTVPVACNTVANFVLTVQGCGVTTSTNVTATPNAQTYVNNFAICGNPPPCPSASVSSWYNGGLMIGFSNSNQTAISYSWNMGDGTTYTWPQGNHTYAAAGTYTVCHQAVYANNCVFDTCFSVTVSNPVLCSVNAVVSASPNSNTIQFATQDSVAAGVTPVSVFWDMGNGYQTNNYPNGGSYTYPNAGTYTACVTVAYSNGCTATDCQTITVGQNAGCPYILSGVVTNGQTNLPVVSQLIEVHTSFGVYTTQTNPNGYYNLTIIGPCNTSFTSNLILSACGTTNYIPVTFMPNMNSATQNLTVCNGGNPVDTCAIGVSVVNVTNTNSINFSWTGGSGQNAQVQSVYWDLGNGFTSYNYPNGGSYTYQSSGSYTVCAMVLFTSGCVTQACTTINVGQSCSYQLSGVVTNGQNGLPATNQVVTLNTSYGNYTAQTNPNGYYVINFLGPCNIFFNASVNTSGCNFTQTEVVNVNPNTANYTQNFTICNTDTCVIVVTAVNNNNTNTINFAWSGTTNLGTPVQSVIWDFGNGVTSNNYPNGGTYTYPNNGTYTICATVTYASGCVATNCYTVNVGQGCPYIVSGVVTNAQTGLPVTSQIVTVNTSFGTYSAQTNPNGYYIITFLGSCNTAFNAPITTSGCGITYNNILNVTPNSSNYTQNFTVCGLTDSCNAFVTAVNTTGTTINFQWAGNSALGAAPQSVWWDFGNGVTSFNYPNGGTYTYPNGGTYNVCVEVTYSSGCVAAGCYTITVGQNTNQSFCGCVTYLAANTGTVANVGCGTAYLVQLTNTNTAIIVDSTVITPNGYCFNGQFNGLYTVYAVPCAGAMVNYGVLPTYLGNVLFWNNASTVVSNNYQANCIQLSSAQPSQGPGQISGNIFWGEDKAIGDPVVGVKVLLLDMDANPLAMAVTDDEGFYSFGNLPYGTYRVYPEVSGLITYPILVTISAENAHFDYANFSLGFGIFTGVEELSITEVQLFPNPASEYIQAALRTEHSGAVEITIYDMAGRRVYAQNQVVSQGESVMLLNIQSLKAGMYTLSITQHAQVMHRKFIKK